MFAKTSADDSPQPSHEACREAYIRGLGQNLREEFTSMRSLVIRLSPPWRASSLVHQISAKPSTTKAFFYGLILRVLLASKRLCCFVRAYSRFPGQCSRPQGVPECLG